MLKVERLEWRDCPAAVMNLGVLTVAGHATQANVITVDAVGDQTRVTLNGDQSLYSGVTQLVLVGGNKADDISNNTAIPATIVAGAGNDSVFGGNGNDVIVAGSGKDLVYDLLGANTIVSNDDNSKDTIFSNFASVVLSDRKDQVVTFFAPGRTPGSGNISLENGVLYLTPNNNGNTFILNEVGNKVFLTYNMGNGPQVTVFSKKDIDYIAFFGGTGNDVYLNNTSISEASYGSAGNDLIVGGTGDQSVLKGSGGSDVLVGRAKNNDMSSNGGNDILVSLFGKTTFRTRQGDVLVGADRGDLVVAS